MAVQKIRIYPIKNAIAIMKPDRIPIVCNLINLNIKLTINPTINPKNIAGNASG